MKTSDQLITEISNYIERLKKRNKADAYYPSLEMTHETASVVESYFKELGYVTEFKRCIQCRNKYDVVISWN